MIYFSTPEGVYTQTKPINTEYDVVWLETHDGVISECTPKFQYKHKEIVHDEPAFIKGASGEQYAFTFILSEYHAEFIVYIATLNHNGKRGNINDYYDKPQEIKYANTLDEVQLYFEQLL